MLIVKFKKLCWDLKQCSKLKAHLFSVVHSFLIYVCSFSQSLLETIRHTEAEQITFINLFFLLRLIIKFEKCEASGIGGCIAYGPCQHIARSLCLVYILRYFTISGRPHLKSVTCLVILSNTVSMQP